MTMTRTPAPTVALVPPAANQPAPKITDVADQASSKIHNLVNIVRLAAFACEARRVLEDIQRAAEITPDVEAYLGRQVEYIGEWAEHPDIAAQVLRDVAGQIDDTSNQLTNYLYSLAHQDSRITP